MDAVFFDTNRLRNTGCDSFFGDLDHLQRIANFARVYIPSIVMDEIKQQKIRYLEKHLAKFKDNYFTKYLSINLDDLVFHIEEKPEKLRNDAHDEIEFVEYHLKDSSEHIHTLKTLALKKHPPFSQDDGNDKGFKDSIIYLSIKQYLEDNSDTLVFLFTNDGRLKDAFDKNNRVKILKEFDENYDYRKEYFYEDYFIGRLNEYFGASDVSSSSIIKLELTDDDDWRMVVSIPVEPTFAEEISSDRSFLDDPNETREFHDVEIYIDFISREIIEDLSWPN